MNVTLINPPSIVSKFAMAGELVPPIGLAYLAATLRKAGHTIQLIDAIGERPQTQPYSGNLVLRGLTFIQILQHIDRDAEVIGLSGMFSSQWPHYRTLLTMIKQRFPNVRVIAGGEHFTAMPGFCLQSCLELDGCVLGEGEKTFLQLLTEPVETIDGYAYRQDGRIVIRPAKERIQQIDALPWPAWDLIPLDNYLSRGSGSGVGTRRAMPMIATRGCPFQCTFCSSPAMWTTKWLARDVNDVLNEIQYYQQWYGIEEVQFYDLTAIIRKDWIVAFAKGIIDRGIKITWQLPIGTRSEAVDREVADWLYRSGCINMGFAPESGSPATLKRIKKKVNLANMKQSIRGCVERGLNVKANIILGFPGQTHREIWETFRFALALSLIGVHDLSFFPFSPYPGTELFDDLQKAGRLPEFTDQWFLTLSYVDIALFQSYSEHISANWLRFYQFFGFALFYGSQFIFRPWRLLASVKHLVTGHHQWKWEQTVMSMIKRVKAA